MAWATSSAVAVVAMGQPRRAAASKARISVPSRSAGACATRHRPLSLLTRLSPRRSLRPLEEGAQGDDGRLAVDPGEHDVVVGV